METYSFTTSDFALYTKVMETVQLYKANQSSSIVDKEEAVVCSPIINEHKKEEAKETVSSSPIISAPAVINHDSEQEEDDEEDSVSLLNELAAYKAKKNATISTTVIKEEVKRVPPTPAEFFAMRDAEEAKRRKAQEEHDSLFEMIPTEHEASLEQETVSSPPINTVSTTVKEVKRTPPSPAEFFAQRNKEEALKARKQALDEATRIQPNMIVTATPAIQKTATQPVKNDTGEHSVADLQIVAVNMIKSGRSKELKEILNSCGFSCVADVKGGKNIDMVYNKIVLIN